MLVLKECIWFISTSAIKKFAVFESQYFLHNYTQGANFSPCTTIHKLFYCLKSIYIWLDAFSTGQLHASEAKCQQRYQQRLPYCRPHSLAGLYKLRILLNIHTMFCLLLCIQLNSLNFIAMHESIYILYSLCIVSVNA